MQFLLSLLSLALCILGANAACQLGDSPISLTSWSGSLSSPGWNIKQYPSDQDCLWKIKVSQGSRIKLTFTKFDLEDGYFRNSPPKVNEKLMCNDAVKVVDGAISSLFSGCQSDGLGRTFESTGNEMSIYFKTDESTQKAGFQATYEGICESNITEGGFLESPGYPNPPPDGVTCEWNVTSQNQQIIYIRPDENDTKHVLPDCGSKLLNWETTRSVTGVADKNQELCRGDSKIVTISDVLVTYNPATNNTWTGRLYLDYSTKAGCERYCDNGFQCMKGRSGFDPGDYRCLCDDPYSGRNCEIYTDPCDVHNCSGVGTCVTAADRANFECDCQPGFSGGECEIELDPCQNLTCLNGGTCEKQNATLAKCNCPPRFEPPDCRAPTSPCASSPCQHSGTCMKDGTGGFTCTCTPEYTGTLCTILDGEAHCTDELDSTVGSGIRWVDTLAGYHDEQPCPTGITGSAKRNCIKDDQSPTGGLWRRPDLSDCVSPAVLQLARDSRALTQAGVEGDVLYNVTRRLANVTSVLKGKEEVPMLYPGDLLSATDVLGDISRGVVNALSVDEDPPGLAQYFTSSIDNIVDPGTMNVWKNARVHLVENKVTSLLTSAQRFAENLVRRQNGVHIMSRSLSPGMSYSLLSAAADNVDLVVTDWNVPNTSWSPSFPELTTTGHSSIRLPPDLLNIARGDGSDRHVKLYTGRFLSIAPLLSLKEYRYSRENEDNATKIVNSDIISAEVLDLPRSAFSKLNHPVEITFRLTDPRKRKDLKKYCVFMNMTTSEPEDRWLDDGCYLQDLNSTHVTCYCYHMTNFGVLLDVYDNNAEFDEANSAALSYISYIGGSLSILACVVVVVVFEYFRLRSDRVRIHEQLALSIIAVQILFLIGVGRTAADPDTPEWACKTVAILLHYSMTALFCWMLVEGIHIYVLLVKVFKRGSHLKKYLAIGWGVPFIVVGISVGVFYDKYGDGDKCWLSHELLLVCMVPTVSLVIIINTVILILVLRVMLRSLNSTAKANTEHQSSVRTSFKASAVLLPLLGLTWMFGFLTKDFDDSRVMLYIFTYLFVITNSFQGVMFFVFHCLLNVDVHNAYERRYRQRKRAISSGETTTRKSSEASTYLADSTPNGKSTTKTNFSDITVMQRKPSMPHNRFLLFDNHHPLVMDPTHPANFDRRPSVSLFDGNSRDLSFELNGAVFDDIQASDTDQIWRRNSLDQNSSEDHLPNPDPAFHRVAAYPVNSPPGMDAFVSSMHDILDRPARSSVHFSED
ncbi:adhesion G protein-coupled receptor L4-like [Littorina saxatilis]|uniref:Uncharacterized protein n=1 Tax=Littorina saxatilis TaxID=31220 RepID=A0AAN9B4Q5_9CAEN